MQVLIIGMGAREHALAWKISHSSKVEHIFVAPGNAGCDLQLKTTSIELPLDDIEGLVNFAKQQSIDLTLIGPETCLLAGITDHFQAAGLTCFGPTQAAALLGAHPVDQTFFQKYKIPILSSKSSNEEFLYEFNFLAMVDGYNILPLGMAKHDTHDLHLEIMGAYSLPTLPPTLIQHILQTILQPTILGMAKEGRPYTGFLSARIAVNQDNEAKLIHYHCSLGDPETQVMVSRLNTDLIFLVESALAGRLNHCQIELDQRTSLSLVLTTQGYPDCYETGMPIHGLDSLEKSSSKPYQIFHAGTRNDHGVLTTNGGRVLSITALGKTLSVAQKTAYEIAHKIHWEGIFFRSDFGSTKRYSEALQ